MKKNKLSINYLLINNMNGVLFTSLISSNLAIEIYPSNAFLIPILLGILTCLLIIILPNHQRSLYPAIVKQPFSRGIIISYLVLSSIFLCYMCLLILTKNFYLQTAFSLFMLFLAVFLFIILSFSFNSLINLLSLWGVLIIFINAFQFFNVTPRNYLLIWPFDMIIPDYKWLFLLFYFLDSLLLLFVNDDNHRTINKKTLIISTICISVIASWFIFDNYTYLDYHFFSDLLFPSLYRYKLYVGPKYIEHFNLFMNINCCVFLISKLSFNINLLRNFLKIKNSFLFRFLSVSLLGGCVFLLFKRIDDFKQLMYPASITLTVLSLIIYLIILRTKNYDQIN